MSITDTWSGTEADVARIHGILDGFPGYDPLEALIPALHQIQEHYRYVPEAAAEIISARWHIPLTDIFNVLIFYSDFRTEPQGRNLLWVCEGAACYFMGGPQLGEAVQSELRIAYNETTEDGEWTIRRADFCFGACHLAPLVEVNHTIVGNLTPEGVRSVLANPPARHEEEQA